MKQQLSDIETRLKQTLLEHEAEKNVLRQTFEEVKAQHSYELLTAAKASDELEEAHVKLHESSSRIRFL